MGMANLKARSYLLLIQRFDFINTLVTIAHVLQSLLPLTTILQAIQCDLVEAAKEASSHYHLPPTTREGRSKGVEYMNI